MDPGCSYYVGKEKMIFHIYKFPTETKMTMIKYQVRLPEHIEISEKASDVTDL